MFFCLKRSANASAHTKRINIQAFEAKIDRQTLGQMT
jgi:hypothetical protein